MHSILPLIDFDELLSLKKTSEMMMALVYEWRYKICYQKQPTIKVSKDIIFDKMLFQSYISRD